jgi:LacI family transcriptional regulator
VTKPLKAKSAANDVDAPKAAPTRPLMSDVASEANVSVMTVSRVLHNESLVADETRQRVLAAVKKLNYRLNESARNLRLGRDAGVVGLIVANLANPFYSKLALGVETAAAEYGRRLMIGNSGGLTENEENLVSDFESRRVDGLIVTPAGRDQRALQRIAGDQMPFVLVGTPPSGINADCVLVDDFGGALEATRRMIQLGREDLAFIGSPPSLYTDAERFRGFSAGLEEAGVEVFPNNVRRLSTDVAGYELNAREILSGEIPPSAIFCSNNRIALGVLRAIISMKRDVAIICFDEFEIADLVEAPLILVSFDAHLLGERAAQMLMEQLEEPSAVGGRRITVPATLIEQHIGLNR